MGDVLKYFLERLDTLKLEKVIKKLVTYLIRKRSFEDSRIRNKYWQVIIDGTGLCSYKKPHCPNCLIKKHKDKNGNFSILVKVCIYPVKAFGVCKAKK